MEAGGVKRTRSGRAVKPPARYSPEPPVEGFDDDFDSDEYDDEEWIGSETTDGTAERADESDGDPDYVPGTKSASDVEIEDEETEDSEGYVDGEGEETDGEEEMADV